MKNRLDLWTGKFGDEYHERQQLTEWELRGREAFWQHIFSITSKIARVEVESVLEIGAGTGINLEAIDAIAKNVITFGMEPNASARARWSAHVRPYPDGAALKPDMVFTFGVLIHVPPEGLDEMMASIYNTADRVIVCAEYFAPSEEAVPYRGHDNALWRRDYGSLWIKKYPDLSLYGYGFAWKPMTALDNITWWCFKKD